MRELMDSGYEEAIFLGSVRVDGKMSTSETGVRSSHGRPCSSQSENESSRSSTEPLNLSGYDCIILHRSSRVAPASTSADDSCPY
ncbi:MAG: hypothetical protein Ct9H300mP30_2030 [Methanobacteriota archaeon]|nr:MAG: hypothetical protein Ct9H300mP30_2030 [Euryarchaeota archaeon]